MARLLLIATVIGFVFIILPCSKTTANESDVILTKEDLLEGIRVGRQYVKDLEQMEEMMVKNADKNLVQEGTPGYTYAQHKSHSTDVVSSQSKAAIVQMVARQHLGELFDIPVERINFDEVSPVESDRQFGAFCGTDSLSVNFRTADGTCNNPYNPLFGQAGTIFQYLLGPMYKDGISKPRTGPSPRAISLGVVVNESISNSRATMMMMQFGQFLIHDLVLTPVSKIPSPIPLPGYASNINCCAGPVIGRDIDGRGTPFGMQISPLPFGSSFSSTIPPFGFPPFGLPSFGSSPPPGFGSQNSVSTHPECFPITIPPNDPIYGPNNCMNFVRSAFGLHLNGSTPSSRRQINGNTHWLDGSHIYGSSAILAESLRDRSSGVGQLRTSTSPSGRAMLPNDFTICCDNFLAGDARVNQQPLLTIMHTLFLREHNRVAQLLFEANPGESDDWYYKQARRFVVAKWQHIVYKEYLPVLLGPTLSAKANVPRGVFPPGNPAIFSEFSTAAFRMGHSQIKSFIRLLNRKGGLRKDSYFFGDSFSSSKISSPDFMDSALRGLVNTPVQQVDNSFADDVTSQLFRLPGAGNRGFDLVSFSIQRGRDHGLYPYVYYRQPISGNVQSPIYSSHLVLPSSFDDLVQTTPREVIEALRNTYKSVADVDLYIGGVTEIPVPGGLVGPTFGNIIAKQFQNLKQADNFFYENPDMFPFNNDEVTAIKKASLARIICDNSDGSIIKIQPNVFLSPDEPGNKPVSCVDIPIADFF